MCSPLSGAIFGRNSGRPPCCGCFRSRCWHCWCSTLALRSGQLTPALRVPVGLVCLLEACWLHLWFAYQSKFTDRIKTVLLNTIRLTLGNLGTTFLMVVLTAVMLLCVFFLLLWMGPLLLILPGLYVALYSALLRRLLRKSFPQ